NAGKLTSSVMGQFGPAATTGQLPDDATVDADDKDLDEEAIVGSLKVLASIAQGLRLQSDADSLGFERNPHFDGNLIVADNAAQAVEIADGLKFTVAGPMPLELQRLRKKHDDWLAEITKKGKSPHDALSAYVDDSITNLSSIVVLAEAANGKRILL